MSGLLPVPSVPRYFISLHFPPDTLPEPQHQYKPQLTNWWECIDGLTQGERGVGFGEMPVTKLAETCNRRIIRKALQ